MFGHIVHARTLQVDADVHVQISSLQTLSGDATYTIANNGDAPVTEISFLIYGNQFGELSKNLPVYSREWIYPSGFIEGRMDIEKVAAAASGKSMEYRYEPYQLGKDHIPKFIMTVALSTPLKPKESTRIKMAFSLEVPTRRGRFGYYNGVLSLAGGWMPRPLPLARELGYGPLPMRLDLDAEIAAGYGGYIVNRMVRKLGQPQRLKIRENDVSEATLVLMDQMALRSVVRPEGKIHFITNHKIGDFDVDPKSQTDSRKVRRYSKPARRIHRAFQVVDDVRELFSPFSLKSRDLVILEIPAWDRLSQISGNVVLLSDRTFEVVPYPKALMFHQSDVAKTVATALIDPLVKTGENEFAPLVSETIGYHFQKRYIRVAEAKREELAQLLRFLAFNPYVDNLIYAPQMPFEHAYVRTIEETDHFRGELWRTLNLLPRGKRIAAKLADLLGKADIEKFYDDYIRSLQSQSKPSFQTFLGTRISDPERFRRQWYGPYPRVNYGLGKTESVRITKAPQKKSERKYLHRVTIVQTGEPIAEPVTVLLKDRDKRETRLKWDGEGMRGDLEWHSGAPLKSVQIDPDYRLVETAKVQGHPLSDNTHPLKMRPPLLTELTGWTDLVTLEPFIYVAFSFRRKYDISNSFHTTGAYTPRRVGGDISYIRHFGYNRTLNARTWYFGPRLGVYKYLDATETEPTIHKNNRYTATLASVNVLAGMDDRQFQLDPQSGKSFQISLGYWVGKSETNGIVQHAKGSLRLFKVIPLALGHTLVAFAGISAVEGEPPASNLVTLSHQQILRGFELGETYGRVGVYGVTEYRHTLKGSTSFQFPFRTLLSRIQGVVFTGVGSSSRPQTYRSLFQRDRNFMEVGYGLRFHLLLLGAVPYLIALDLAIPILPTDRRYLYTESHGVDKYQRRQPYRFTFGINQTF